MPNPIGFRQCAPAWRARKPLCAKAKRLDFQDILISVCCRLRHLPGAWPWTSKTVCAPMNTRSPATTPLLLAAAIAIAMTLYAAARYPSSVTERGLAAFSAAVVPLAIYLAAAIWARRASAGVQAALRIGTVTGLSMAAVGVLYHIVEISTSLPASLGAVLGAGMWGAMFLAFGMACSATFTKEKSLGLGVLSSAWCGMTFAAVLVACALAIGFTFMPHMQRILAPVYSASETQAPPAFVVRHEIGAAGEHLSIAPAVASFVGLVSGFACWFLNSVRRQAAVALSIVATLVFAAGVLSIRFATSLERAERPPFILFGLAALAVTLASAHPLVIAVRKPAGRRVGRGGSSSRGAVEYGEKRTDFARLRDREGENE